MGLELDEAKALQYFRSASDSGCALAAGSLGFVHEYGKLGLDENLAEAQRGSTRSPRRKTWCAPLGGSMSSTSSSARSQHSS